MINYAGGLTYTASSIIELTRLNSNLKNITPPLYFDFNESKNYKVLNGDRINPRSAFITEMNVEISGQVKVPGKYNYFDGMKISDLLNFSGGLSDTTFLKSVNLNQAEIIRRNPKSRYENVIPINLSDVLNGSVDYKLSNLDRIVIHANENYFQKEYITINGEVNVPGAYPLIYDNESLNSIINRSGGLTKNALKNGISIYRKILITHLMKYQKLHLQILEIKLVKYLNKDLGLLGKILKLD